MFVYHAIPLLGIADAGDQEAAWRLVGLLAQHGDIDGLRERADAGDTYATARLAELLAKRGDIEGLRTEVLRGNTSAADRLIAVVTAHSADAGTQLRQFGLNADGSIPWEELEALP